MRVLGNKVKQLARGESNKEGKNFIGEVETMEEIRNIKSQQKEIFNHFLDRHSSSSSNYDHKESEISEAIALIIKTERVIQILNETGLSPLQKDKNESQTSRRSREDDGTSHAEKEAQMKLAEKYCAMRAGWSSEFKSKLSHSIKSALEADLNSFPSSESKHHLTTSSSSTNDDSAPASSSTPTTSLELFTFLKGALHQRPLDESEQYMMNLLEQDFHQAPASRAIAVPAQQSRVLAH